MYAVPDVDEVLAVAKGARTGSPTSPGVYVKTFELK